VIGFLVDGGGVGGFDLDENTSVRMMSECDYDNFITK
jgi:hypothetical protein